MLLHLIFIALTTQATFLSASFPDYSVLHGNIFLYLSLALIRLDYYIEDAFSLSEDYFSKVSKGWEVINPLDATAPMSTTCGPDSRSINGFNQIYGGPDLIKNISVIKRVYGPLPPHNSLRFSIKMMLIDGWDLQDRLYIEFFGGSLVEIKLSNTSSAETFYNCGEPLSYDTGLFDVIGRQPHTASTLELKFWMKLVDYKRPRSFAFKEITIAFFSESVAVPDYCLPFGPASPRCRCVSGFYWSPTPSPKCLYCHENCKNCFGPSAAECYTCADGFSFNGTHCAKCPINCVACSNGKCTRCSRGYTLYWDGSCQYGCYFPFVLDGSDNFKLCKLPCTGTDLWHWTGTCVGSCPSQLINTGVSCDYPCNQDDNEYLYWDNTCKVGCNYRKRLVKGYKVCEVCSSNEFMYSDGSCRPVCPPPMIQRTQDNFKFCDACPPGKFIYMNSTCVDTCLPPKKQKIVDRFLVCEDLCPPEAPYFHKADEKCHSSCTFPNKLFNGIICQVDLDMLEAEITGKAQRVMNTLISILAMTASLLDFTSSGPILLISLTELLHYFKFMSISYPQRLYQIFAAQSPTGGFTEYLFSQLGKGPILDTTKQTLSPQFTRFGVHSNFFVHFWPSLLALTIFLPTTGVVSFIRPKLVRYKKVHSVCVQLEKTLKWNFVLIMFLSCCGNITLFTALEFKTFQGESEISILSLLTCFAINTITIFVLIKIRRIIKTLLLPENKTINGIDGNEESAGRQALARYRVIFEDYKEESFSTHGFVVIFLLRIILFNFLLGYLNEYPFVQAIPMLLLNISMIVYLKKKAPMKHKIDYSIFIIQENIVLAVNICVTILAVLDAVEAEGIATHAFIGEMIIWCYVASSAVSLTYMVAKNFITLRTILSKHKAIQVNNIPTRSNNAALHSPAGPNHANSNFVDQSECQNLNIDSTFTQQNDTTSGLVDGGSRSTGRKEALRKVHCAPLSIQRDLENSFSVVDGQELSFRRYEQSSEIQMMDRSQNSAYRFRFCHQTGELVPITHQKKPEIMNTRRGRKRNQHLEE